ncbi:MAG: hypothetical protein DRI30_07300 [Chloroflexi bacterium]|nr:MAG: hypothetical protein DRI30_07300 [Chloroflexota bacterium]
MRNALITALMCIAVSTSSFSQTYDEEAERLRQENDERGWEEDSLSIDDEESEWEEQRRKQRWLENEEIRRANEQRAWEARRRDEMRIENERIERNNEQRVLEAQRMEQLRLENEQREREAQRLAQLRLENEARERAIAKAAALEVIMQKPSQSGVVEAPNILEQLRKLGQLKDSGYLTESEFQELKKKLLDDQN